MLIELDYKDRRPIYEQVTEKLEGIDVYKRQGKRAAGTVRKVDKKRQPVW